jgi:hypothetical protein
VPVGGGAGFVGAIETLEDVREIFGSNAVVGVLHG